jgi:hypothetical protein
MRYRRGVGAHDGWTGRNAARRAGWSCVLALASVMLGLPHAVAQSGRRGPALNWVRLAGAESCIAPVELAERVERRLGWAVFVRMPDAIVVVEGQVAPSPAPAGGFVASLRVSDMDGQVYGERELVLDDADCRRLDELVALVIAVTIRGRDSGSGIALPPALRAELDALFGDEPAELDPALLPARVQHAGEEPAMPSDKRGRGDRPAAPPPAQGESERGLELGAGIGFSGVTGLQPDGTVGPSAHLRVGLHRYGSAVLGATLGFAQELAAPDPLRGDGTLTLAPLFVTLALCAPDLRVASSALAVCAHLGAGAIAAESEGFADNRATRAPFVEVGPEASVRASLFGPLYARLALRLPARLSRPAFAYRQLDGSESVAYRVAPFGVGGELALGVDLF